MKKYFAPAVQVEEAQVTQMLAASLAISDTTVSGSEALTKENVGLDIWDEDEE